MSRNINKERRIVKDKRQSMNHIEQYKRLRLKSRNEGKIKSYKSSLDLRSWSHDADRRSRYLQEWMKSDMPICILPAHILANFLNIMTCRSRRKVTPKCHPDCKSKLVLDSIRNSCHAMQECIKNSNTFNSYFQEEEFETCNWPCDKCLEVLKSIKMLWKIIVEKLLNINLSKAEEYSRASSMRHKADTVHSVAKMWEKEVIEQTVFVNKVTPLLKKKSQVQLSVDTTNATQMSVQYQIAGDCIKLQKRSPKSSRSSKKSANFSKTSEKILQKKVTKCTSVKIQTVDVDTNTGDIENEEAKLNKHDAEFLQKQINRQVNELEHLKEQNYSLKLELQNFYEKKSWHDPFFSSVKVVNPNHADSGNVLPMPYESCEENASKDASAKTIDSEMIITMKNGRNENFKHVSLLQVLHKTNEPIKILDSLCKPHYTKENPIELLTKVQNTFGELVRRELDVINNVNVTSNNSEITASFCKVNASRSEPSCTTVDFCSRMNTSSSESHFVSL